MQFLLLHLLGIYGATQTGKSNAIWKLLIDYMKMFAELPVQILLCYNVKTKLDSD